jgi:predicted peptidase
MLDNPIGVVNQTKNRHTVLTQSGYIARGNRRQLDSARRPELTLELCSCNELKRLSIEWKTCGGNLMRSDPIFKGANEGYELSCLVSLPEGYPSNSNSGGPRVGPWPLICFLHGYLEAEGFCESSYPRKAIIAALRAHGPLKPGSALPEDSFIVVAPQLPGKDSHWTARRAMQVEAVLARVGNEFDVDLGRAYLTGFSTGGNGVYDLFDHSTLPQATVHWAKLWPVEPTRVFADKKCPPIWLWYGTDTYYPNNATACDLVSVPPGRPVGDRLCTYTAKGHVPTATDAYQNREVYAWLDKE